MGNTHAPRKTYAGMEYNTRPTGKGFSRHYNSVSLEAEDIDRFMRQCGTIRINKYVEKNKELSEKLNQAGITLPKREADIWDWAKTITPV